MIFDRVAHNGRGLDELRYSSNESPVVGAPEMEVEGTAILQLVNQRLNDERENVYSQRISPRGLLHHSEEILTRDEPGRTAVYHVHLARDFRSMVDDSV